MHHLLCPEATLVGAESPGLPRQTGANRNLCTFSNGPETSPRLAKCIFIWDGPETVLRSHRGASCCPEITTNSSWYKKCGKGVILCRLAKCRPGLSNCAILKMESWQIPHAQITKSQRKSLCTPPGKPQLASLSRQHGATVWQDSRLARANLWPGFYIFI